MRNGLQNIISEKEKILFKTDTFIDNNLLNSKLNFLIDLFTESEKGDLSPEKKGIEIQENSELTSDTQVGKMLIETTLKNAEIEEALYSIGKGVVEIMLNQPMGGM